MAERKAVNKYYPPDWDPRKGSVNKRVGQHPLRDRAKKLSQGILVIRFELPYNIWCGGCGSHVGMGVRYNAEKSKVGNYYSTPIYKFRMKCHLCDNYFEIQTDPQNHDYVILSGARRKEQRWDPHENEQIVPEDKATQKKMATDAMYKLEHGSDDKQKGSERVTNLAQLEESRISMVDDYLLNRMARDKFRAEKKVLKEAAEADRAILERASLDIDLVEETEEDRKVAGLLKYTATSSFEDKQKEKRKNIEMRPLFDQTKSSASSKSSSASSSSDMLPYQRHMAPQLSRRGELKQKLGWALKASYKDPFKSAVVKSRRGPGDQSSRESPRSLLGIKLKSPRTPTANEAVTKADDNCEARAVDGADCESSVSSPALRVDTESSSVRLEDDASSNIVAGDTDSGGSGSSHIVATVVDSKDGGSSHIVAADVDSEVTETATESSDCRLHDSLVTSRLHSCREGISSGAVEATGSSHVTDVGRLRHSSRESPAEELESPRLLSESGPGETCTSLSTSLNCSPGLDHGGKNNSGLLALMSSYTESDSASDSS